MELDTHELALVEDLRQLPEAAAQQVVALAHRMAVAAKRGPIDWSETWSEEDMRDYTRASAARLPDGE